MANILSTSTETAIAPQGVRKLTEVCFKDSISERERVCLMMLLAHKEMTYKRVSKLLRAEPAIYSVAPETITNDDCWLSNDGCCVIYKHRKEFRTLRLHNDILKALAREPFRTVHCFERSVSAIKVMMARNRKYAFSLEQMRSMIDADGNYASEVFSALDSASRTERLRCSAAQMSFGALW